jgi:hypothetical protein
MIFIKNFFYFARKSVINATLNKFSVFKKYSKIFELKSSKLLFFFFKIWISESIRKKNIYLSHKYIKIFNDNFFFNKNEDWFSHNIPIWDFFLKKEINLKKKIQYLEIGSYEGRSAVYICSEFKNFFVTAVDPFLNYEEIKTYINDFDMEKKYEILKKNLNLFSENTKIHRLTSDEFFIKNNKKFDVIYIDGSHKSNDVKNDFLNAIKVINQNGLIILDDLTWQHYKNLVDNPFFGIFSVLKENPKLKIISVSNQLIVKKI